MNDFTKRAALLVTELIERGATDDEIYDAICFAKSLHDISKAYKITTLSNKYSPDAQPVVKIIDPEAHTFRFDPVTSAYPKKGDTFDIFWGVKMMLTGYKIKAVDWLDCAYMRYSPELEIFVYEDGTVVDFVPFLLEHMNNNLYTIYEEEADET